MSIWRNPMETPDNGSLVILEHNNNLYMACVYHQDNRYYMVDPSEDIFWDSEIDRWCYLNDIKNLK